MKPRQPTAVNLSRRSIVIVSLTPQGQALGERLLAELNNSKLNNAELSNAEHWFKPTPFAECVQTAFAEGRALIFICATGIVVRTLAPVIVHKHQDPPVLVLDETGKFVIPLLSGHEGGANEWGSAIADYLQAQLVITTANSYVKPLYTIGMGCERGCPKKALDDLLQKALQSCHIDAEQITAFASIDIKADEVGLLELANSYDKPFLTYDAQTLLSADHRLSTRSDYVFKTVGVYGVAESAAFIAATAFSETPIDAMELILPKIKSPQATCAIVRCYSSAT